MLRSRPIGASKLTPSTKQRLQRDGATMELQACDLSTQRVTTARSCSIQTATTSRPSTTGGRSSGHEALSKAKQACLTAAAKIPIASLKQEADAQCNKIKAQ
jgi:hypothetical protein